MCGQENGDNPTLWVLISSPMVRLLWVGGFGTDSCGEIGDLWVFFVEYAFVDYTDLLKQKKHELETINYVLYQMQEVPKMWEGLI